MKLKTILLTAALFTFAFVFAETDKDGANTGSGGGVTMNSLKTSVITSTITVGVSQTETIGFDVNFGANFGYVTVNIVDIYGTVFYSEVVNTSAVRQMVVDASDLPVGGYRLVFKD